MHTAVTSNFKFGVGALNWHGTVHMVPVVNIQLCEPNATLRPTTHNTVLTNATKTYTVRPYPY